VSVAVIGNLGVVGRAMEALLRPHVDVVTYDRAGPTGYPTDDLARCEFAVVCVGTPPGPEGTCDIGDVVDAVDQLPVGRVLLKSTVPPGTTDGLIAKTGKEVCFWPEYVGETPYPSPHWPSGMDGVPFVVIGGRPESRRRFIDDLLPMLGPARTYFQCTAVEAEVIKYMENAYFATKVTFVNEFRAICEAVGADWHTVREGWLLDPRVDPDHTAVFTDAPGFGGRCLPKDVNAIVAAARTAGYTPELLQEVLRSNDRFRAP
jgi:nucleotide sugar dehydrogenase